MPDGFPVGKIQFYCVVLRSRSCIYGIAVSDKTEADSERERALIEQWVCLTEERNAVLVPSPGSNIPGAPADW